MSHPAPALQLKSQSPTFPFKLGKSVFELHKNNLPGMNVIVAEKGKIAYAPIPKNACSSLKLFFYELINGAALNGAFNTVHGKFNYNAVDFERFAADKAYYKFVVVRDPVDRFISAYNNRVKMYRELSQAWFKSYYPDQEYLFSTFKARSLNFNPEIGEFANHIEDYIELNHTIRHHFIPQYNFFHSRLEAFDRVYNIRELGALAQDLEARLEQPVKFRSVQETKDLQDPARLEHLSGAELAKVKSFYREDYRLLAAYL